MSKVCLIVIDGWGVSEETRGELNVSESCFYSYFGCLTR